MPKYYIPCAVKDPIKILLEKHLLIVNLLEDFYIMKKNNGIKLYYIISKVDKFMMN